MTFKTMITVKAIQCPNCKDTIYSRAQHDFHNCSCGAIFIDGGFHYTRVGWDPAKGAKSPPKWVDIKVKSTMEDLYRDWNTGMDKFGTIKMKPIKRKRINENKNRIRK